MNYVYLIVLIALAQYLVFTNQVGLARGKYKVKAPKTTGDENFERIFRVQQNTMEEMIVFIPAIVLFAHFVSSTWALVPGVIYLLGRQIYAWEYMKNPDTRTLGMVLTMLPNIALVLGALIGLVMAL